MPIVRKRTAQPITHVFADDGNIPNNVLPLVLYRGGIDLTGSPDPEALIEKTFTANGWRGLWPNGIYPYVHYHSMIHEAMAVARGRTKVRFGRRQWRGDRRDGRRCGGAAGRYRPSAALANS